MSPELDLSHPELAPAPTTLPNALLPSAGLTRDQVELLKRTICKDATDDELSLFVAVCNHRRLNPFTGQIHFVKRRQWNTRLNGGEGGYEEVASHQTGIDGYRLIAERTGRYGGPVGTWWCGPDGKWRDVWLEDTPPAAAKVAIQRTDFSQPSEAIARWKAYVQTKRGGVPNAMWARMDAEQLAKCAEALVLRRVFPEELSGIYTTDEMAQAGNPPAAVLHRDGSVVDTATGEMLAGKADEPLWEQTQNAELWADDLPTAWAIDNVRDPDDAKWLLQQPEVSDDYREAVKRVVAAGLFGVAGDWAGFWRAANATQWREVLRQAIEQSDPGSRTGGVGSMAPGDAGESAPHSPGSDPTESPSTPEQEAGNEAGRSGVEGANHQRTEPGAGEVSPPSDASVSPEGPPPPGRTSGGTKGTKP
jgi:phage recombination protein Bet